MYQLFPRFFRYPIFLRLLLAVLALPVTGSLQTLYAQDDELPVLNVMASCGGDYNVNYDISYADGKTTITIKTKKSGNPAEISHINFPICGDEFLDLIKGGDYEAYITVDGGTRQDWKSKTVLVEDPSTQGCYAGITFKFDNIPSGTEVKFELIVEGNWTGSPDLIVLKYGNSCCTADLEEDCFDQECVELPDCTITGPDGGQALQNSPINLSVVAIANATYSWSVTKDGNPVALPQGTVVDDDEFTFTLDDYGEFVVSVTITTEAGCVNTCTFDLHIVRIPEAFCMTAKGYCADDENLGSVSTDKSEVGVTYQLFNAAGNVPVDNPKAGDGNPLVWTNVPAGEYYIVGTVDDDDSETTSATNCDDQGLATVTVVAYAIPQLQFSVTNASCPGGADGAINLTVSNLSDLAAPITYLWSPGGQDTEDISGLAKGTYSVVVTDDRGCDNSGQTDVGEPLAITCSVSGPSDVCVGTIYTYSASVNDPNDPDLTPYTFEWEVIDLDNNSVVASGSGSSSFNWNTEGIDPMHSYKVKVSVGYGNNCTPSICERGTINARSCPVICNYSQGYYGESVGLSCVGGQFGYTTTQALNAAFGALSSTTFGIRSGSTQRYFVLYKTDVGNNIFAMLPGSGKPVAIMQNNSMNETNFANRNQSIGGGKTVASLVPMSSGGALNNILLAQTMTTWFNVRNNPNFGSLKIMGNVIKTTKVACGTNTPKPGAVSVSYTLPASIACYLLGGPGSADDKTVQDLLDLANKYLGGQTVSCGGKTISISDVNIALEKLVDAFNECARLDGFEVMENNLRTSIVGIGNAKEVETITDGVMVATFPNPVSNKVTFTVRSSVSGQGQIDLFDMQGRVVQRAFNGYIQADRKQTIEVNLNQAATGTLLYKVMVGNTLTTGKLLRVKQ
jgi:hypothetical protein